MEIGNAFLKRTAKEKTRQGSKKVTKRGRERKHTLEKAFVQSPVVIQENQETDENSQAKESETSGTLSHPESEL